MHIIIYLARVSAADTTDTTDTGGPMMSETAFFVKDVVGPRGSVSIIANNLDDSADINQHSKADALKLHLAPTWLSAGSTRNSGGGGARGQLQVVAEQGSDSLVEIEDVPDHDELCRREQQWLLSVIRGGEDLSDHHRDAIDSLRIVLAADESIRTGRTVELPQ